MNSFSSVKVVILCLQLSQKLWTKSMKPVDCDLYTWKEEIDFRLSSESVNEKLFSVLWFLTLLTFMAFFLFLIIQWVIMYSCEMQNQSTCNQVWTQEMLCSQFQDSQIPSQSQGCNSLSIFVNSMALLYSKFLLFSLLRYYKILNVATIERKKTHVKAGVKKPSAIL